MAKSRLSKLESSHTYHLSDCETIKNGKFEDSLYDGYFDDQKSAMTPNDAKLKGLTRNTTLSVNPYPNAIQKYPARFRVLFLYCLAQISSSAAWLCFASIYGKVEFVFLQEDKDEDEKYNGQVRFAIRELSFVYLLAFIPINFFAIWLIEHKNQGMRKSLIIGMTLQIVGFVFRCFFRDENNGLLYLQIGQAFLAVGYPFIFNMPQKLAVVWFSKNERNKAYMAATNMFVFGCLLSFIGSKLIVRKQVPKN